jgi:hypothetical protein
MGKKQIYVAHCIECGERFTSTFKTSETDKAKIYEMGQEHASGWGAECTSVKKWVPQKFAKVQDLKTGKWVEITAKRMENFIAKNPKSTRYDWTRVEYFDEPEPADVWDNDVSDDENLKDFKAGKEKVMA